MLGLTDAHGYEPRYTGPVGATPSHLPIRKGFRGSSRSVAAEHQCGKLPWGNRWPHTAFPGLRPLYREQEMGFQSRLRGILEQ
jgi:hypothetical protein